MDTSVLILICALSEPTCDYEHARITKRIHGTFVTAQNVLAQMDSLYDPSLDTVRFVVTYGKKEKTDE